jgi:hypothetical protein
MGTLRINRFRIPDSHVSTNLLGNNLLKQHDALVLGAGIQGALAALMLANRGRKVTLVDRNSSMLQGASLNYEGRLHTGMLYSMDRSFKTAAKLAKDAAAFTPTVERLLGTKIDWASLRSTPSRYFVHRDSHLGAEELVDFWTRLELVFLEELKNTSSSYAGLRLTRLFHPISIPKEARPGMITSAFQTAETCIDQPMLHRLIAAAIINHPRITCQLGEDVHTVEETGSGQIKVKTIDQVGGETQYKADLVVNCLWENRALFDRALGVAETDDESVRLKYSLLIQNNAFLEGMGSFILTHGAFGSIVVSSGAEVAFASWYPASVEDMMLVQSLPDNWRALLAGQIPDAIRDRILTENVAGFRSVFRDFPSLEVKLIKAGVIVAHGMRDIDKADSSFHRRDDHPIRQKGHYFSVSTGKYVSVGQNTLLLEQKIFSDGA